MPPTTETWLSAAAALSPGDVWAVGLFQDANQSAQPFTEHWDGLRWKQVAAPAGPWTFGARLFGVASSARADVWAVGNGQNNGEEQTLIERWDGARWTIVPSPNASIRTNNLYAVTVVASDDVWAAGEYYDEKKSRALFAHWDGHEWTVVPGRDPGISLNTLRSVAAVSSHDVWAVGMQRDGDSAPRTLIERWNGTYWTDVKGVDRGESSELFSVVALAADDIWAAGNYEQGGSQYPLIERWDGKSWTLVAGPNIHDAVVNTVAARSSSDVWFGGTVVNSDHDGWLMQRWDGGRWTRTVPAFGVGGEVSAIVPVEGGAWAVGTYRTGDCGPDLALMQRWDGSKWSYVPSPRDGRAG